MKLLQCNRGHFYDGNKYEACPYCDEQMKNDGRNYEEDDCKTVSLGLTELDLNMDLLIKKEREVVREKKHISLEFDEEKTVAYTGNGNVREDDFVTGWLVCIEGPEKGRDYHLFHGINFVGRGSNMQVCIQEDYSISREVHCRIIYDDKMNQFHVVSHNGKSLYLNREFVSENHRLETGDILSIGESEFVFIAFCEGNRRW